MDVEPGGGAMSDDNESTVESGPAETAVPAVEVAALRERLLMADLRTAAVRAGIVDLDGVKLIDMSTVKTTEAGELIDGAEVMKALRSAKPWLFGRGSSSSVAVAPRAEPPKAKTAMEMSVEEWRAARAELLRRR